MSLVAAIWPLVSMIPAFKHINNAFLHPFIKIGFFSLSLLSHTYIPAVAHISNPAEVARVIFIILPATYNDEEGFYILYLEW